MFTARENIQFKSTQKERNSHVLMDAITDHAIYLLDPIGTIINWNNRAQQIKQYTAKDVIGQNFRIFYTPEDQRKGEPERALAIATKEGKYEAVSWRMRKDGSKFLANITIDPFYDLSGKLAGFAKITTDFTERKRTEEQLAQAQKMETVGQLSGGIAHDFNNLLTVIIGNADLLSEHLQSNPELKQLCNTILSAGEHGAELTQRLLAFSRRQTLQPAVIDCHKLVDNMCVILGRTLSEDIEIKISADPNLTKAFADPSQLESAILNLALNARDAMPVGGHLTITMSNASLDKCYQSDHPEVRPGDYVLIALTDDGEGMSPEIRQRAFEPFFTTKEIGKGSGLGLSMVYGFIKQSNGHVAIYSEPGLGTTVRLYLPAAIPTQGEQPETKPRVDLTALRGSETILVAEDDPFVRGHAVASLESLGYRVITAVDGRDALAKLNQNPQIDILFSDVVMPGSLSGWELAEQAQKRKSGLKILLTSGYPMETLATRTRHNPNVTILNKPYRKIELGRRIRQTLDIPSGDYLGIGVPLSPTGATAVSA